MYAVVRAGLMVLFIAVFFILYFWFSCRDKNHDTMNVLKVATCFVVLLFTVIDSFKNTNESLLDIAIMIATIAELIDNLKEYHKDYKDNNVSL